MKRFGRKIKFVIDFQDGSSVEFDERFDIDFSIRKFFEIGNDGVNQGEIGIMNLSSATRKNIEKSAATKIEERNVAPSFLSLYAGYGSYKLIFRGEIRNVQQDKIDTDIKTIIYCYDGLMGEVVNKSVKSMPLSAFLAQLALEMNFDISIDPTINRSIVNTSFRGSLRSVLNELKQDFDFQYYVDDGTLFITQQTILTADVKTVDRESGLVGIPEISSTGSRFSIMLDGSLSVGDFINLKADFGNFNIGDKIFNRGMLQGTDLRNFKSKFNELNGQYRIREITHRGQSRGDVFVSDITCGRIGE